MDLRVYTKEVAEQPGKDGVPYLVPDVIDLQPEYETADDGTEYVTSAALTQSDKDVTEQECVLASIWQRGNDPVSPLVGVRWSEALLGELTTVQVMEDIREAVAEVTLNVAVSFESVRTADGRETMAYSFKAVA